MATAFFQMDLTGDKELIRNLERFEAKTSKKILRKALRAGGKVILAEAKARVPVKTGATRRGLKLRALKRSRRGLGVQVITGTRAEMGISASDKFYYPAILEWGRSPGSIPATAFMRPAFHARRRDAERAAFREIQRGVEFEVGKRRIGN